MTQFAFGSGTLIGKRTDVSGQPPRAARHLAGRIA